VIGYSVSDEVLCPSCLSKTTPITGEKLTHVCRRGPRAVPDAIRTHIVALDKKRVRPSKIAEQLRITLPTVMRVLSGDANDAASCPACEASARPQQRELIPLYFGDATVHDERCTYCGTKLSDLALQRHSALTADYHVDHVTDAKGRPALRFDHRPPDHILQALKHAGWRWSPPESIWVDFSRAADVPAGIRLAPRPTPVVARPPIIRKAAATRLSAGLA
jgi:hypothetical protein